VVPPAATLLLQRVRGWLLLVADGVLLLLGWRLQL
jgi:hypothetical protein